MLQVFLLYGKSMVNVGDLCIGKLFNLFVQGVKVFPL